MTEQVVPHDDPVVLKYYADVVSRWPDCQIVKDEHGTYRFKANRLFRCLVDSGDVSLNRLAVFYDRGYFPIDEYAEFNMGLGYSLSGFCELSFIQAELDRLP